MSFDFNDLGSLSTPDETSKSIELDISLIDEDPDQPRTEFDEDTLNELAETIKERGVKSPISVRHSGDGRYMINHGARRLRASKIAGKTTIPAFIDDDYTRIDQIIENIQRDELKPMDVARFIQSEIERGLKQADIAKELGKKKTWVSDMFNLTKLYPPILELFQQDKFDSVAATVELNRLYKQDKLKVEGFLSEADLSEMITVKDVRNLAEVIKNSSAFDDYTTAQETIENHDFTDDTPSDDAKSSGEDLDAAELTNDEPEESRSKSGTGEQTDIAQSSDQSEMLDISDLDETASEPNESTDLFKTVKEIRCVCEDFGEVTVVFREAEHEDHVVVLTSDGVKEIEATSLKLRRVVF